LIPPNPVVRFVPLEFEHKLAPLLADRKYRPVNILIKQEVSDSIKAVHILFATLADYREQVK
jgi:hypothetical protein